MRPPLILAGVFLAGSAHADRLILSPTGKKVPFGTARIEHLFDQSVPGSHRSTLAIGLTDSIDAELTYEEFGNGRIASFDASYNLLPPLTNLAPGISVGIRDGIGKSRDGRYYYAAATYRFGQTGRFSGDSPAEASLGFAFGDVTAPFFGLSLPFRESFRLLAEFDTRRVSGGFEFRPHRDVWVRWIHRESQSLISLTVSARR